MDDKTILVDSIALLEAVLPAAEDGVGSADDTALEEELLTMELMLLLTAVGVATAVVDSTAELESLLLLQTAF